MADAMYDIGQRSSPPITDFRQIIASHEGFSIWVFDWSMWCPIGWDYQKSVGI